VDAAGAAPREAHALDSQPDVRALRRYCGRRDSSRSPGGPPSGISGSPAGVVSLARPRFGPEPADCPSNGWSTRGERHRSRTAGTRVPSWRPPKSSSSPTPGHAAGGW